ncbi:unknown [Clostridium sp. CAG:762]|nr:unknown [Clostridium sp. CAG:762]
METVNITEEANAREEIRIFLFLSFLKNINMVPSKVDKPARNVNIKLIIILFIL